MRLSYECRKTSWDVFLTRNMVSCSSFAVVNGNSKEIFCIPAPRGGAVGRYLSSIQTGCVNFLFFKCASYSLKHYRPVGYWACGKFIHSVLFHKCHFSGDTIDTHLILYLETTYLCIIFIKNINLIFCGCATVHSDTLILTWAQNYNVKAIIKLSSQKISH